MSWSVRVKGTKAELAKSLPEAFDEAARPYAGTPEAEDVEVVKQLALKRVAQVDLENLSPGDHPYDGVSVYAWGSHGFLKSADAPTSAGLSLSVERARIKV